MTIPTPIVIIGIGEMAGVFARGFLRAGFPVYPVNRNTNLDELVALIPDPTLTLLAVAEKDLHASLEQVPPQWQANLTLLQNELLPRDWQSHGLSSPTVISVWFEKKKGQDYKVLVPSPVYGSQADIVINSLAQLDIPTQRLDSEQELLYELVRKNVYILTTNIAGLIVGGTVETLWNQHQDLAREVATDVIDIQDWLTGQKNDRERLIAGMLSAIEGDLQHRCMGRSAPARLSNAIRLADEATLQVPKLREIFQQKIANG
ncbi:MAG: hypothetical protein AMJ53_12775 [Gammaproteobacteria bacterium SG8_11]|nr:MAG: hypothetical protein AMJ53_12775 [Gammaproteobacteria bacterium SG8_11]